MKRTFLKFPAKPVSYLPRIKSRRLHIGLSRNNVAYKSDGGTETSEEDKEVAAIKEIGKQVEDFKKMLGDRASKEEFEALKKQLEDLQTGVKDMQAADIVKAIESINKANESIHKQILEMQEKAAEEKEQSAGGARGKARFVTTKQVEEFIKATFGDTAKAQQKKTKQDAKIEFGTNKAAENFSTATFFEGGADTDPSAFTGRFVDPTLYQRRRKTNLILDYFNIQTISVPELVFLVKVEDGTDPDSLSGDSGGADWILCGDEKPQRSFRVTTGRVEAKKVAIFGTVEDCLLQDVASLERWIREDFMDELREKINEGLLSNNPAVDPNAPEGLTNAASQFTASPGYAAANFAANSTNYIDQLIAAFATMRYRREEPAIAFVSSDVWYLIQHLKDSEGRYQNNNLVYTSNLGQLYIAGVLIVPADQDDIPSTHVLIVGRDLGFKIYAYGPLVFERGLNDDDFRHDRTSFRGYQRFLSFMPTHRENSVLYDTWANIKAGIEA